MFYNSANMENLTGVPADQELAAEPTTFSELIGLARVNLIAKDLETAQTYLLRLDKLKAGFSSDEQGQLCLAYGQWHIARGEPGAAKVELEDALLRLDEESDERVIARALFDATKLILDRDRSKRD